MGAPERLKALALDLSDLGDRCLAALQVELQLLVFSRVADLGAPAPPPGAPAEALAAEVAALSTSLRATSGGDAFALAALRPAAALAPRLLVRCVAGEEQWAEELVPKYLASAAEVERGFADALRGLRGAEGALEAFEGVREYLALLEMSLPDLEAFVVRHRYRFARDDLKAAWVLVAKKRAAKSGVAAREKDLEERFLQVYGRQ